MADEEKPNTEKNLLMKYSNCEKKKTRAIFWGQPPFFAFFCGNGKPKLGQKDMNRVNFNILLHTFQ